MIERNGNMLNRVTSESVETAANFVPIIDEEVIYHDGEESKTKVRIHIESDAIKNSKSIVIGIEELASSKWASENYGAKAIIFPNSSNAPEIAAWAKLEFAAKDEAKTTDIYTHTGWTKIDGKEVFLTNNGAIAENGIDDTINVQLPRELSRYKAMGNCKKEDIMMFLKLYKLGKKEVMFTLVAAALRAVMRPSDFAIHLAGKTGGFKTEISSLILSIYGAEMTSRQMTASWSSTGNALEALCYQAKDVPIVIDDYVPVGSQYQRKALDAKVDQVIRAQGNAAGRSRMAADSTMQGTKYPRGVVISTGEDIPEGHSCRSRMIIVETEPRTVDKAILTELQNNRDKLNAVGTEFIRWLAEHPGYRQAGEIYDLKMRQYTEKGHARTATNLANLHDATERLCRFLLAKGIDRPIVDWIARNADTTFEEVALQQIEHTEEMQPEKLFTFAVQTGLSKKTLCLKNINDGVPPNAARYGWRIDGDIGGMPNFVAAKEQIGWIDEKANEVYIDPMMFREINRAGGGRLAIGDETLKKRLSEAGMISRRDAAGERLTIRKTLGGMVRAVMCLKAYGQFSVFGEQEEEKEGEGEGQTPPEGF